MRSAHRLRSRRRQPRAQSAPYERIAFGNSVDVEFAQKEKAKYWDLRVEDGDGNSITWNKLNLLEISKLTLHYDDGKASADAE